MTCAALLLMTSNVRANSTDVDARWPPYYQAELLLKIEGTKPSGDLLRLKRGYVLHRKDLEKVSIRKVQLRTCHADLEACEVRAKPSFWDSPTGKILTHSLAAAAGIVLGVGTTVLILKAAR